MRVQAARQARGLAALARIALTYCVAVDAAPETLSVQLNPAVGFASWCYGAPYLAAQERLAVVEQDARIARLG